MRTIKTTDIRKEIFDAEEIEDVEYFEDLLGEASATRALEFFHITWNRDSHSIDIPDELAFHKALAIVNLYLDYHNDEIKELTGDAKDYDDYTRATRGADDGTFDYAGTFVISILCVCEAYLNT